jgi:hypothetical protein
MLGSMNRTSARIKGRDVPPSQWEIVEPRRDLTDGVRGGDGWWWW